jgi:ABC-2 type transport system permease protein
LLVAVTTGVDVSGFGQLGGGLLLLAWTLSRIEGLTPERVLLFLPLLALSVLTLLAFALFMSGTLFVWIGNSRVLELLDSILIFGRYPGSIFSSGFQLFLAVLIPVSMVALFPAEAMLGRTNGLLIPGAFASLVFFGLGVIFWNHMCGKYAGGGG